MPKVLLIMCFVLLSLFKVAGQALPDSLEQQLVVMKHDTQRVNLLHDVITTIEYTDTSLALVLINKALYLSEQAKYNKGTIKSYYQLGEAHNVRNNYSAALEHLKKGATLAQQCQEDAWLAEIYLRISWLLRTNYNYEGALEYSDLGFAVARKAGLLRLAMRLAANTGVIHEDLGEYQLATKQYLIRKEMAAELQDTTTLISATITVGSMHFSYQKDYAGALTYYHEAMTLSKLVNKPSAQFCTLGMMGLCYAMLNEQTKANICFHRADSIEQNTKAAPLFPSAILYVGKHMTKVGFHWEAINLYSKIGQKHRTLDPRYTLSLQLLIAESYAGLGNYDSAYHYQQRYSTIKDSVFTAEKARQLEELQTYYETQQKENAIQQLELNQRELQSKLVLRNFILFGFMLIAIVIVIIYYSNQRRKRAELGQQLIASEQAALRAQMNPHFIFNCLTSIQRFITQNDGDKAGLYLARFAQLIRMTLDNSREKAISLTQEIDYLNAYLDLEQLRFKGRFQFNITVEENIDPTQILVPTMLIQPYAENALKHGLDHKEGEQSLSITFALHQQNLHCTITDNGIGRALASTLQPANHKSIGMQITYERLEALNVDRKKKMTITINDVLNENDEVEGTIVVLIIPQTENNT